MLKLHFAPNSRAGRIVWLLEELNLPYEINKMDLTDYTSVLDFDA